MRFFFFGSLMDADVLAVVLGRPLARGALPRAWLVGWRRMRLAGQPYPILVPDPDGEVDGILVEGLNETDVGRVLFYESMEYRPATVVVTDEKGVEVEARTFLGAVEARHDHESWDLEAWRIRYKAMALRETRLWMALYGRLTIEEADRRWKAATVAGKPLEDMVEEVTGVRPNMSPPGPARATGES